MNSDNVCILILNWNGWQDTIECLESLRHSTYAARQVVVLDNGSTDGSLDHIAAWAAAAQEPIAVVRYDRTAAELGGDGAAEYSLSGKLPLAQRLILIDNGANLGFAAGNNVGIRFALARSAGYVLLLNNDTVVEPPAVEHMVALHRAQPQLGGITPQIRYYDRDAIWNCGGDLTWYGSRRYHFHGRHATETPQSGWRRITFITGCAALFPSDLFRRVGLLSEQFFFGEEDYELSLRLQAHGIPLACCFDAVVRHKVGSSIARSATAKVVRSSYIYHLSRSIDLREHWRPLIWQAWRHLSLLYILPLLRLRHGVPLSDLRRLAGGLLRNGRRLPGVDKATFERAMLGSFD